MDLNLERIRLMSEMPTGYAINQERMQRRRTYFKQRERAKVFEAVRKQLQEKMRVIKQRQERKAARKNSSSKIFIKTKSKNTVLKRPARPKKVRRHRSKDDQEVALVPPPVHRETTTTTNWEREPKQDAGESPETFLDYWLRKEMRMLELETKKALQKASSRPSTWRRICAGDDNRSPGRRLDANLQKVAKSYRNNSCQTIVSYGNKEHLPKGYSRFHCAVPGCTVISERGVAMFAFPRVSGKRAEWLRRIGLREAQLKSTSKVCRWHFHDKYVQQWKGNKCGCALTPDAVPVVVMGEEEEDDDGQRERPILCNNNNTEEVSEWDEMPDISDDYYGVSGFAAISVKEEEEEENVVEVKQELVDDNDVDQKVSTCSVAISVHSVYADPIVSFDPRRRRPPLPPQLPAIPERTRPPSRQGSPPAADHLYSAEPLDLCCSDVGDNKSTIAGGRPMAAAREVSPPPRYHHHHHKPPPYVRSLHRRSYYKPPKIMMHERSRRAPKKRPRGRFSFWCVVPGCDMESGRGITLFAFPDPILEPERRAAWFRNIGLGEHQHAKIFNSDLAKICQRHFPEHCLTFFLDSQPTRLASDAVPVVVMEQQQDDDESESESESDGMLTDDDDYCGVSGFEAKNDDDGEIQELSSGLSPPSVLTQADPSPPSISDKKSSYDRHAIRKGMRPTSRCVVPGCGVKSGQRIALFSFPYRRREPERRAVWFRNIGLGRSENRYRYNAKVCQRHFPDRCLTAFHGDRPTRLTPDAVPVVMEQKQEDDDEAESDGMLTDDNDDNCGVSEFEATSVKEEKNDDDDDDGENHELPSGMSPASVLTQADPPIGKLLDPRPPSISDKLSCDKDAIPKRMPSQGWCVVPGCGVTVGQGVTLFSFPNYRRDWETRAAWFRIFGLGKCKRDNLYTASARVCQRHFPDRCFTHFRGGRPTRLVEGAVPVVVEHQNDKSDESVVGGTPMDDNNRSVSGFEAITVKEEENDDGEYSTTTNLVSIDPIGKRQQQPRELCPVEPANVDVSIEMKAEVDVEVKEEEEETRENSPALIRSGEHDFGEYQLKECYVALGYRVDESADRGSVFPDPIPFAEGIKQREIGGGANAASSNA